MDQKPDDVAVPTKPKLWGPVSGILLGLVIFMIAQTAAYIVISIMASAQDLSVKTYYDQNPVLVSFVGSVLLGTIGVGLVYLATKKYDSWTALKLKRATLEQLFWVLPGILAYIGISAVLYVLVDNFFPGVDLDQEQNIGFDTAARGVQLALAFVALVVIAPISEEILFRGYTFQGVRRSFHWIIAAVVSAGLFGVAHGQFNVAMDTFALGITACWLLEKTGSLWPAILLHGIKNFIAFYFVFVVG